jgi:hypothetical protein
VSLTKKIIEGSSLYNYCFEYYLDFGNLLIYTDNKMDIKPIISTEYNLTSVGREKKPSLKFPFVTKINVRSTPDNTK